MPPENPEPQHDEVRQEIKHTRGCIAVFVAIIILLVIVWVFAGGPATTGVQRERLEKGASEALGSLGTSQMAYARSNDLGNYGRFRDLIDSGYLDQGSNLNNVIEDYHITCDTLNSSTVMGEFHEFTIIAYPTDTRPGFLHTMGIAEDQVVRVYNPENGNDFRRVETWDPYM